MLISKFVGLGRADQWEWTKQGKSWKTGELDHSAQDPLSTRLLSKVALSSYWKGSLPFYAHA